MPAIACRAASSAAAGARSINTSTLRRISRTAARSTRPATNSAAIESASGTPARTPISTASDPAKSLPKWRALENSAALRNLRAVRHEVSVREMSIASTSPITRNAHQAASTWMWIRPASRATASPATPTLTRASTPASNSAARSSAFPWPYWCCSSAGRTPTPTGKNVRSAATRSVPEWSASETRPSEPLAMPATSFRASSAQAATTETSAVRRCGLTSGRLELPAVEVLHAAPRRREQRRRAVELEQVARHEGVQAVLERLLEVRVQHDGEPRQSDQVDDDVAGQHRAHGGGEAPVPAVLGQRTCHRGRGHEPDDVTAACARDHVPAVVVVGVHGCAEHADQEIESERRRPAGGTERGTDEAHRERLPGDGHRRERQLHGD